MRGIRRFQRTMITLLIGINIMVFSASFYGDLKTAFAQSLIAMGAVALFLIVFGSFQSSKKNKKSTSVSATSEEN